MSTTPELTLEQLRSALDDAKHALADARAWMRGAESMRRRLDHEIAAAEAVLSLMPMQVSE